MRIVKRRTRALAPSGRETLERAQRRRVTGEQAEEKGVFIFDRMRGSRRDGHIGWRLQDGLVDARMPRGATWKEGGCILRLRRTKNRRKQLWILVHLT